MQREEKGGGSVGVQASTMSTLIQYSDTKSWGGLLSEYISHIFFSFFCNNLHRGGFIFTRVRLFAARLVCQEINTETTARFST